MKKNNKCIWKPVVKHSPVNDETREAFDFIVA